MIHVIRPQAPAYFNSPRLARAVEQLSESKLKGSQQRVKFGQDALLPVRDAIHEAFGYKCAYCESMTGVAATAEIDNFRPKGGARGLGKDYAPEHYWWLAYEWNNLYLACQMCNQRYKCNWFPLENEKYRAPVGATGAALREEQPLLLDPCYDHPEEHLAFSGDGTVQELSKRGKVTIEILGLNRKELVAARRQAMAGLQTRLELYKQFAAAGRPELEGYVKELFSNSPGQRYAAAERAFFKRWLEANSAIWKGMNPGLPEQDSSIGHSTTAKKSAKPKGSTGSAATARNTRPAASSAAMQKVTTQLEDSLKRFSIQSVEIRNFRSIAELRLEVPPINTEGDPRESWLLLLGDNGVGKSSILQAIALTLSGAEELKNLKVSPKDILRKGAKSGSVAIRSYEHDAPVVLEFDAKKIKCSLPAPPSFVLAYGATRLLPKGDLQTRDVRAARTNVCNLFDYSVALADVNKWLKSVKPAEFEQRIAPALFDLLDLQDGEKVVVKNGVLIIEELEGGNELDKVSDGYKGMIAVACDIMKTLSVDGAGYHTAQGIVLIDELGNHLHPKWRMKIAGALRRTFPKLQFIVSTHEPLCLRGLDYGEVVVLMQKGKEGILKLDKSVLPDHSLLRVDQLLTSDLFGLLDTLDPATQAEYDAYYELLSKKPESRSKEDNERIRHYTEQLTKREIPGANPRIQALYQVVNEQFVRQLEEDGFKTIEELKKETVTEVKDMLATKSLDWL